jgi:hypothetical protein
LRLAEEPKHWISVTAPLSASTALALACPNRNRVITLCTTCGKGIASLGCAANSNQSGMGRTRVACN